MQECRGGDGDGAALRKHTGSKGHEHTANTKWLAWAHDNIRTGMALSKAKVMRRLESAPASTAPCMQPLYETAYAKVSPPPD